MSANRHRMRSTAHHPIQLMHQRWNRRYGPGTMQAAAKRAIARELGINRRKIKRIIDHPT